MSALSIAAIKQAATRIANAASVTPVIRSSQLDNLVGARVFLKAECLQRTGSFKFRGALNRLRKLERDDLARGVVAWSSGNHAQGMAEAAAVVDTHATIVMPRDTPQIKIARTERAGADIVFYDRLRESREEIGYALAERSGAIVVPPYDDYDIMAGQGTCGLEFYEQCVAAGNTLDALLIPCGGGGLAAGVGTAFSTLSPTTRIYGVEPAVCNDHERSLRAGHRVANDRAATSICDALLAPSPGKLTFPINQKNLTGVLTAADDEVRAAVRFAATELKLVLEPGGAIALAVLLAGRPEFKDQAIGVILSGGNIDNHALTRMLAADNPQPNPEADT